MMFAKKIRLLKKVMFCLVFSISLVGTMPLVRAMDHAAMEEENSDEASKAMSKAMEQVQGYKNAIAEDHWNKMINIKERLQELLQSLNSDIFRERHIYMLQQWLALQDQNREDVQALQCALQDVYLQEFLQQALSNEAFLQNINVHVQQFKEQIKKLEGDPEQLFEKMQFEKMVTFCSMLETEEKNSMDHKLLDYYRQAITLFLQKISVVMKKMDEETLASAHALKAIYEARYAGNQEQEFYLVIASLKPSVQTLKKDLNVLVGEFDKQTNCLKEIQDKNADVVKKCEAYAALGGQLKQDESVFKNFDAIYSHALNNNWKKIEKNMRLLGYASHAYNLFGDFFELYKADCGNDSFKGSSKGKNFFDSTWRSNLLLPNLINVSFFVATQTMNFNLIRNQMSNEAIKPFVMGKDKDTADINEQFAKFSASFGNKCPAFQGIALLPAPRAIKFNAAAETLQKFATNKINGFTASSQTFNSVGMMTTGGSSFEAQQAKKLIISALYYHTVHQRFSLENGLPHAGLTSYQPWVNTVLTTINWGSMCAAHEIEALVYKSISFETLENVEKYSLGVVTPDIVSKLVTIGKDGLLSNKSLKPWFDKVAKFDQKSIYGQDFHTKFPKATDGKLFGLYAERELFSYGIGCLAKFVGSHAIKSCSGFLLGAAHKLGTAYFGKEAMSNYIESADFYKDKLAQGLGLMLGGAGCEEFQIYENTFKSINSADPDVQAYKAMFECIKKGRSFLLTVFGLREKPGKYDETNAELLENILYKVFVYNPMHVRIISSSELSDIKITFKKNPQDTKIIADKLINVLQQNVASKLGGKLCGWLAESRARNYWNNRDKPILCWKPA